MGVAGVPYRAWNQQAASVYQLYNCYYTCAEIWQLWSPSPRASAGVWSSGTPAWFSQCNAHNRPWSFLVDLIGWSLMWRIGTHQGWVTILSTGDLAARAYVCPCMELLWQGLTGTMTSLTCTGAHAILMYLVYKHNQERIIPLKNTMQLVEIAMHVAICNKWPEVLTNCCDLKPQTLNSIIVYNIYNSTTTSYSYIHRTLYVNLYVYILLWRILFAIHYSLKHVWWSLLESHLLGRLIRYRMR